MDSPRIESRVEPGEGPWTVQVSIPLDMVCEQGKVRTGDRWKFSFSRYDYTRGTATPVLSSSSPHAELSFHRQQEWGTLVFG